jgi:very-short-patch-repair endonuclease
MPHRPISDLQRGNARRLRREMTDAERKLWYAVRARRLARLGFRRQVPIGPFIVDFFCPEHRLIIELDGSQHGTDEALRYDAERTEWLAANGYRVMRFWNREVLTNLDGVPTAILEATGPAATPTELAEEAGASW